MRIPAYNTATARCLNENFPMMLRNNACFLTAALGAYGMAASPLSSSGSGVSTSRGALRGGRGVGSTRAVWPPVVVGGLPGAAPNRRAGASVSS